MQHLMPLRLRVYSSSLIRIVPSYSQVAHRAQMRTQLFPWSIFNPEATLNFGGMSSRLGSFQRDFKLHPIRRHVLEAQGLPLPWKTVQAILNLLQACIL